MNYWVRMILEVALAMVVYAGLYRFAKPLKSWTLWLILMLAVNTTITAGATLLVKSTGWNELYARMPLESISIGTILAFAPRRALTPKVAESKEKAPVEETHPGLKKRKKPKY